MTSFIICTAAIHSVTGINNKNEINECVPKPSVMTAQPNIGGALCESSVIPLREPHHKVWLTPTAGMPCSNAANIGERNTWTQ